MTNIISIKDRLSTNEMVNLTFSQDIINFLKSNGSYSKWVYLKYLI